MRRELFCVRRIGSYPEMLSARSLRCSPPLRGHHDNIPGRVRLEGANYFWFFTGLMLVASLAFMIVAKLYRPREYYHDDHEAEVNSEATAH